MCMYRNLCVSHLLPTIIETTFFFFFLNDPPPTESSPLPLHAPLPIGERQTAGAEAGDGECHGRHLSDPVDDARREQATGETADALEGDQYAEEGRRAVQAAVDVGEHDRFQGAEAEGRDGDRDGRAAQRGVPPEEAQATGELLAPVGFRARTSWLVEPDGGEGRRGDQERKHVRGGHRDGADAADRATPRSEERRVGEE